MAPTIAPTMAPRTLGAVDFVVIGVYVCICVGLGMWAGRKPQAPTLLRQHIRMLRCRRLCLYKEQILSLQASTNDYFLAERYTVQPSGMLMRIYRLAKSFLPMSWNDFFFPLILRSAITTLRVGGTRIRSSSPSRSSAA